MKQSETLRIINLLAARPFLKPEFRWHVEKLMVVLLSAFPWLPNGISSTLLISLLLLRIWFGGLKTIKLGEKWLLMLPAFVLLIAWAVHGFAADGTREMQLWLTWLAALIYFTNTPFRNLFFKWFVNWSVLMTFWGLFALILASPLETHNLEYHVRQILQDFLGLHPTYLSAIWLWTTALIFLRTKKMGSVHIIAIALLMVMATMAGGKMPLLAFVIMAFTAAALHTNSLRWRLKVLAGVVVVILSSLMFNPVLNERVGELGDLNLHFVRGQQLNATEVRLGVWNCALDMVGEHWLAGVGVGNTRKVLDNCYARYDQTEFFVTEFNTHNQYLHFWLSGGIFGFLLFVGFVSYLLVVAFKNHDWTFLYFVLFFSLLMLTENYFGRQVGMMFGAFFMLSLKTQRNAT